MTKNNESAVPAADLNEAAAPLTDARIDAEARSMKQIFDAEKKVSVFIKDKDKAPPVPVTINGYRFEVPVNVKVEVPQSVHDLLLSAGYIFA